MAGKGPTPQVNQELRVLQNVLAELSSLQDLDARRRVITYMLQLMNMPLSSVPTLAQPRWAESEIPAATSTATTRTSDIRTLTTLKRPRNAVEMATLVAYYLTEHAPTSERRETIGTKELQHYFRQAAYPLPRQARQTLFYAKQAGYLDPAAQGEYKLSPVGYNLIAHTLPQPGTEAAPVSPRAPRRRVPRRRAARKGARRSQ